MADEWYYTNAGQQMGPVSTGELKQLAAARQLQPTDLVWREGLPKWVPASSARGLFPDHQPAATPAAPAPGPTAEATPVEDNLDADLRPPRRRDEEDDLDRPRRRRREEDEEAEEERPRRRRRDYDEEEDFDERPRRRRRPTSSNRGLLIGLAVGGGFLAVLVVIVLLVVLVAPGGGPGSYDTGELAPGQTNTKNVYFPSGKQVEITVTSDLMSDVDLHVLDPSGNEVASDVSIGPNSLVRFTPRRSGNYRLVVINLGPGPNRSHVKYK